MESTPSGTIPLLCHPQVPSPWVEGVTVGVGRSAKGLLLLSYGLKGALEHLRIPAPGPVRRGESLWEHTCLEAFIGRPDETGYHECNFSPSRAWAVQGFRGYRDRESGPVGMEPRLKVEVQGDNLILTVEMSLAELGPGLGMAPLKLALAAVIEDEDGHKSYWALKHAPGRPDFHRPEAFALDLPAPDAPPRSGTIGSLP